MDLPGRASSSKMAFSWNQPGTIRKEIEEIQQNNACNTEEIIIPPPATNQTRTRGRSAGCLLTCAEETREQARLCFLISSFMVSSFCFFVLGTANHPIVVKVQLLLHYSCTYATVVYCLQYSKVRESGIIVTTICEQRCSLKYLHLTKI